MMQWSMEKATRQKAATTQDATIVVYKAVVNQFKISAKISGFKRRDRKREGQSGNGEHSDKTDLLPS